jgi:xylulokinase
MNKVILGIDIGTSSSKVIAFDQNLEILGETSNKYETIFPDNYKYEQDPDEWWNSTVSGIKKLIINLNLNQKSILGIGVSSQAPTIVPVDSKGIPLRNAFLYSDIRSIEEFVEIKKYINEEELVEITGNKLDPFFGLSKIFWMKKHELHLYKKTYKFLPANSYINFKLTDICSIDIATASLYQLLDISKKLWSKNLCNQLGLDLEKLPDIYYGGEIIGNISKKAASVTGLPCGVPVIACAHDGAASALSAGIIKPGVVAEMNGTSTVLFTFLKKLNINTKFILSSHILRDNYLFLSTINATGGSLNWFKNNLYKEITKHTSDEIEYNLFKSMTKESSLSPPGSNGLVFLPYIYGERSPIWNPYAKGVFFGINSSSSRSDFMRSIFEGTSFAVKHNIQSLEDIGYKINEIRSVGGLTKNKFWNQIKADILGKPILIMKNSVGAPFGNAIIVGKALNMFKDIFGIINNKVKIKEKYFPNFQNFRLYEKLFKVYKNIYINLKDDFIDLYNIYNK